MYCSSEKDVNVLSTVSPMNTAMMWQSDWHWENYWV